MAEPRPKRERFRVPPLEPGVDFKLLPEVRFRDDAPSVEVDEETPAQEALERIGEGNEALVLRDTAGEPKGVVLTPERYIQLIQAEIQNNLPHGNTGSYWEIPGSVPELREGVLESLMIEQVDPEAEWSAAARVWPPRRLPPSEGTD